MTVKVHYDNHLGNFYSWYTGDFGKNKDGFKNFCLKNGISPSANSQALDLGAGSGIQSVAIAEIGFKVKAIDFNNQLIEELKSNIGNLPIEVIKDDLRIIDKYAILQPELIVCCGDTLTHLENFDEIKKLINDASKILFPQGKVIFSFRDYSSELNDTQRFIPVKSDSKRILTCVIEYFPDKLRVTDLLHEYNNGQWVQKVSSYYKTRITDKIVVQYLLDCGFEIVLNQSENRIISIIGRKK